MGKLPITITMIRMKWLNMLNINTKYQLSGKNERNEDKKKWQPNMKYQTKLIDKTLKLMRMFAFSFRASLHKKKNRCHQSVSKHNTALSANASQLFFIRSTRPITKFRRLVAFFALFFFYPVSSECANRYRLSID